MSGKARLEEIENHYSYYDVVLANEVLDIEEELQYLENKEIERKNKSNK